MVWHVLKSKVSAEIQNRALSDDHKQTRQDGSLLTVEIQTEKFGFKMPNIRI